MRAEQARREDERKRVADKREQERQARQEAKQKSEEERLLHEQEDLKKLANFHGLTTALKEEADINMFGDVQSDNDDDFVMPVYNEPPFEDSPAEAEDDKFEETPQVVKQAASPLHDLQEFGEDSEDVEMEEDLLTGESPPIQTSILDEHFKHKLEKHSNNPPKLARIQK